jgi:N,N'-diacetyllegionaminate synthase
MQGKNMKTFIIAEAGVNHNGNIDNAIKMIDTAVECGVDCIKFQTFKTENLVSKKAKKAEYQVMNTQNYDSQLEMLKKLELSFDDFKELNNYSKNKNILFLSTPFDLETINFLESINIPFWKIPSGEITNLPYLLKIAKTHKSIIMSTGMSNIDEIEKAFVFLKNNGSGEIKLLHCNTEYPTPYGDVNLRAMQTLKEKFQCEVGYSDHTQGIEVSIAAVAMGASIIEKHFTLDKNMEGPDHKASLAHDELKAMITSIRNIEKSLGTSEKKISASERKNIEIARKSIVAKKEIKKGEIFTEDNVTAKRPGNGISPMKWFDVIGKIALRNFEEDDLIEL